MSFLIVIGGFVILIGAAFLGYYIFRLVERKFLINLLQIKVYSIKIPQEKAEEKDLKIEINKSEQLFSALASLHSPVIFEVAVPHIGEEIHFYMAVNRNLAQTAIRQVQGIWPKSLIEELPEDYNIFNPAGSFVAATLSLKDHYALPIRTYSEINADTFLPIIEGFSKISEIGEGAAMQLIINPAPKSAKKNIFNYLNRLKKGESLNKILKPKLFDIAEISEVISPSSKDKNASKEKIIDDDSIKALESKLSKPLFSVNVRFVASASSSYQANEILNGLVGGFSQFTAPAKNEFNIVKFKNSRNLIYKFIFRQFDESKAIILNTEEIASFFHLPTFTLLTPRIKWLKSVEAPPPSNLPTEGTIIGESSFRGERKIVRITDEDRMRHVYTIGQTGTGKTTFMINMIYNDIHNGKGVAVIDPHGDLIDRVLGFIPKDRIDDLILFNPADIWRPLGLNMLEYDFNKPEEKTFIVNEMQSMFDKLFSSSPEGLGPMFQQYMRNSLLLLMEDAPNEPATLMEVSRIFTDDEFRNRKLARIKNPAVIDFWEKEAIKTTGEAGLANMTPYITSKFNNFTANDYMRPIIGQTKSAFNFREVMDNHKILLVNLAKGKIGDINANLLGMIVIGKILMASLSRVDLPESQRRDFYLYIDEFQNFTTDSIAIILSEARKYRLSLTIAHQFIAQLTDKIKDAVFGNVGSMIVFRVSADDAEFLVRQFEPVFDKNDLMNIDNRNAYVKILINGQTSKPFNIKTINPPKGDPELANQYREYSRMKYGVDRQVVEEEIYRRLRE